MYNRLSDITVSGTVGAILKFVFAPITYPLKWIFEHRCDLDDSGCCTNEFCSIGKLDQPGWGQMNNRWVRRQPLPITAPKGPPPLQKEMGQYTKENVMTTITMFSQDIHICAPSNLSIHVANNVICIISRE